jgi:U3 small nucleolar RNA-associated protein 14
MTFYYPSLQAKRAKFDKNSKTILNDQLSKHREMLTKHGEKFDDAYEQDEETAVNPDDLDLSKVPKGDETFEEFSSKARKFYTDEQEKKQAVTEELDVAFENAEFELKQSNKRDIAALKRRLDGTVVEEVEATEGDADADGGEGLVQADSLNFKVRPDSDQQIASLGTDLGKELLEKEAGAVLPDVDPANFLEPTRIVGQDLPEIVGYNEQDEEDPSQMDLIAEAFADDDVVESFRAEKDARVAAGKPKSIDLTLPGWGEWGGGGAQPSRRKRKRFTVKAPPAPKRRDENNKILIINTEKDEKIRSHQVSNIPFPFTSVSDFEVTETHMKLLLH